MTDVTVVIPTYNGGDIWRQSVESILQQNLKPAKILVIDSSSADDTVLVAKNAGFNIKVIDKSDFDHGGTRTLALKDVETEIVIFMTQDAILDNECAFENLLKVFDNQSVSAAYGRQLPHYDANPLAIYARENSYGCESYVTSLSDDFPKGFRKAFMSNSFAAYRVADLNALGGFPERLILGEDSYFSAKALMAEKSVAYVADAIVRHSHNYKAIEEFKRYFDIGVFHSDQSWMLDELGSAEGEGLRFAVGQIVFLIKRGEIRMVFSSALASLAKYIGYKLGRGHAGIPLSLCRKMSMYKGYWQ
ncbi:MAG: O-antigen biosynthesis protein [Spongiibacter sp.]|uniref:glycosyltransferase family 2 protein n=1 Tax=Spongiibacter sp. TaxID=2024860 RepID=UPI000C0AE867|nr:glycosyltransferase [Spongiibacter sp.]MAK42569.1 O-antigen biosynthesis protein [Spongiibacter sp.]|tara:strand:+ start:272 stop:1183 length:912 start_codon:yes stop_codon:yes gene_type:complete